VTDALLRAGADIVELNTVRKHLSRIKGGRLAEAAFPAAVINLVVSDVVGNDLQSIASGPTHWDSTTFADALRIMKKYGLWTKARAGAGGHPGRALRPDPRDAEKRRSSSPESLDLHHRR
jgi:glycerate-2-kinase